MSSIVTFWGVRRKIFGSRSTRASLPIPYSPDLTPWYFFLFPKIAGEVVLDTPKHNISRECSKRGNTTLRGILTYDSCCAHMTRSVFSKNNLESSWSHLVERVDVEWFATGRVLHRYELEPHSTARQINFKFPMCILYSEFDSRPTFRSLEAPYFVLAALGWLIS